MIDKLIDSVEDRICNLRRIKYKLEKIRDSCSHLSKGELHELKQAAETYDEATIDVLITKRLRRLLHEMNTSQLKKMAYMYNIVGWSRLDKYTLVQELAYVAPIDIIAKEYVPAQRMEEYEAYQRENRE